MQFSPSLSLTTYLPTCLWIHLINPTNYCPIQTSFHPPLALFFKMHEVRKKAECMCIHMCSSLCVPVYPSVIRLTDINICRDAFCTLTTIFDYFNFVLLVYIVFSSSFVWTATRTNALLWPSTFKSRVGRENIIRKVWECLEKFWMSLVHKVFS